MIEYQDKIGLRAVKLPSADAVVVRRTLLVTLMQNPRGLPGINESPEHSDKGRPTVLSQCENLPKGGVYTPGIVFGPDLQERLQENGVSFDLVSKTVLRGPTAA
ncbi:hypothetical protein V6N13_043513 [Hibiscus sabdariffa]